MKRLAFAICAALVLTAEPSLAMQGGPKPKAPKPAASASKPKPSTMKVKPVKTTVSKPKLVSKPAKPVKTTSVKTAKMTTKPAKVEKVKTTTPVTTTTTITPTGTVPLTPVQQKLQKNTNLASKLQGRLPAGTDLMRAAYGFRNLGQFVAAVNVSNNLGIPFAQLKTKMVTEGLSLGQSIQVLRPASSGTVEAQRAEYDARGLITQSERELTPTTTLAATSKTKTKTKPKKGQP